MTIQQVQYVLEIARCGSISRAAASLYLSQPALSAQVRALEQELDCRLFRRSARGVETTEAGARFCRWAEPAAQAWAELRQRCGELKNVPYETVRIGFDVRAQSNGLTRPVLDYFDRRPSTELSFITDMYQNALEALAEKRLDLAICRLPPQPLPPAAEELTITPLLTERQCILMSPEAAGESPAELPFSYLSGRTVVCGPRGSVDDAEMAIVRAKYAVHPARVLRSDDIGTVMALVKNGRGCALGPASLAERFGVSAVPLTPDTRIDLNLICRRSDSDLPLVTGLREELLAFAAAKNVGKGGIQD